MRILITGSRSWKRRQAIIDSLDKYVAEHAEWKFDYAGLPSEYDLDNWVLMHGACPSGADKIADEWAKARGIRVEKYRADWKKYGRAAGPKRNQQMVDLGADICIAFMRPESKGTKDCLRRAREAGIPTITYKEYA